MNQILWFLFWIICQEAITFLSGIFPLLSAGALSQPLRNSFPRQDALGRFKDGRIRVLVATDIAARGIDVSGLSHVFNYDLPNIPETYVHRIGRTGRAGHAGVAVSFCDFEEKEYLADIEKLTHIRIPSVEHEWPMQVFEKEEKQTQGRGQRAPRAERAPAVRPAVQAQQQAPARKKPAT